MRLLLDTHIFLWYISGDEQLSESYKSEIRNYSNDVYLSTVSIWEAAVKNQLGKLPLPKPAGKYLTEQRVKHDIASLPLDEPSVVMLETLPSLHRDPFDRMLVCQALCHELTLATVDDAIRAYPVETV